jgi:hypothetical protein
MSQNAQVAELVDALVSNTNAFGRAGSTPALGTSNEKACQPTSLFCFARESSRAFKFHELSKH